MGIRKQNSALARKAANRDVVKACLNDEKLLLSAIANWQVKNPNADIEAANLFVKEIYVDSARQLKRLRPAPQGRGYRIRKRSNHVTLILGNKSENQ